MLTILLWVVGYLWIGLCTSTTYSIIKDSKDGETVQFNKKVIVTFIWIIPVFFVLSLFLTSPLFSGQILKANKEDNE